MPTLDTGNLESLANLDFDSFKALHSQNQNRADVYYQTLKLEAEAAGLLHVQNYADLARSVVNSGSINGILANNFTAAVAEELNVDFSAGSDARLRMQYELMQADLQSRIQRIAKGGTGELNYQDTINIHSNALDTIGLPPEGFSLYTPLSILAEHDPDRAQFLFQAALPGEGFIDVIQDGLLVGFGSSISSRQELFNILKDYGAQATWLATTFEAMQDLVATDPGDASKIIEKLENYEKVFSLGGASFDKLADWVELLDERFANVGGFIGESQSNFDAAKPRTSPLILDLDGSGTIDLTSIDSSQSYFDLDLDGFAELTGWVNRTDGLLVRDLNGNSEIDNISELFGSADTDGFTILSALDSNADGQIDANDANWDTLQIWQDLNGDGLGQGGELQSLNAFSIISIDLNATEVDYEIAGNWISHESAFTIDIGGVESQRTIVDAWFSYDNVNTVYVADYALSVAALFLPTLRGYGELPDLHIAMSIDNTGPESLLELLSNFAGKNFADIFTGDGALEFDVTAIMRKWAGVENVDPQSRGSDIDDARDLAFLEKMLGEPFLQRGLSPNPGAQASLDLQDAYDIAFNNIFARLLAQTAGREVFEGDVQYDLLSDSLTGIIGLNNSKLSELGTLAQGAPSITEFWQDVVRFIDFSAGIDDLPTADRTALESEIANSDPTLTLADLRDSLFEAADGISVQGTSASETLTGTDLNDFLFGQGGNDTLIGGAGIDFLNGGVGDDVLIGQVDSDTYLGFQGNDTYVYEHGVDTIRESTGTSGGIDRVTFGPGIGFDDLTLSRINEFDLRIDIDQAVGGGAVVVEFQFNNFSPVELLEFAGPNTVDITTLNYTLIGTDHDDLFNGVESGGGPNDTILGLGGNDTIRGGFGDDILDGGIGDDFLDGGAGADIFRPGGGKDTVSDGIPGFEDLDTIELGPGIAADDLTFGRANNTDLTVEISNGDLITVKNQFSTLTNDLIVEQIRFSDTTNLDLTSVQVETHGTEGDDVLTGIPAFAASPDDIMFGLGGNDVLRGDDGDDRLFGGDGNDRLFGDSSSSSSNDLLDGGAGNDELNGGTGDDTYVFGAGMDEIRSENGGIDTIQFSPRFDVYALQGNLAQIAGTNTLRITLDDGVDEIEIRNQFSFTSFRIDKFAFADGLSLDVLDNQFDQWVFGTGGDETLTGTTADDVLLANSGNDTIIGGLGNDTIHGHLGDDRYVIESGDGADMLVDTGGNDTIEFGSGISRSNLTFSQDGDNLVIDIEGSANSAITVINHFVPDAGTIETLLFDDSSTFDLTTLLPNNEPSAQDDDFQAVRNQEVTGNVLANNGNGPDSDPDGDPLSVEAETVTTTQGGTATISSNGDFTYTPPNGFTGDDSFDYTLLDDQSGSDTGTVNISIALPLNQSPMAQDDSFQGIRDQDVTGNVLSDNGSGPDSDPDGDPLTVQAETITTAKGGAATISADGDFTYTPPNGFTGDDSFDYNLLDDRGGSDTGTVTISMALPANQNPLAQDDSFQGIRDQDVTGNVLSDNGSGPDSDPDGDPLTVQAETITTALGGAATISASGDFTYTPPSGSTGGDSFDYTLLDDRNGSDIGTVNINVEVPPNQGPVAQDDSFQGIRDQDVMGNVLGDNGSGPDTDPDGDPLSVEAESVTTAEGGTATILASGDFTYTPPDGFTGDDSFGYTLLDDRNGSDTGTVNISVMAPVNQMPVAQDDALSTPEDQPLLGNVLGDNGNGPDTDTDGDDLTVDSTPVSAPVNGTLVLGADGSFTYTPFLNFHGTDGFEYRLLDGNGGQDIGTVSITVNAINDLPVAQEDLFAGPEDQAITGNVLADNGNGEDSDVDGDPLTVQALTLATAQGGSVVLGATGDFTYTPPANFFGADSFDYTLQDDQGGSDVGTVIFTIDGVNDAPQAQDDAFTGLPDHNIEGNVLADNGNGPDGDPENDPLGVQDETINTAQGGTATILANGEFTYAPPGGFTGEDSFDYTLQDGQGGTDIGTVALTITAPANQDPIARDDSVSTLEDEIFFGNVLTDNGSGPDSDPDGDTLTVAPLMLTTLVGGKVALASNGDFSYTPAANFFGSDSFDYTLLDGQGGENIGTVSITVDPVNDVPVAQDDMFTGLEDQALTGNVLPDNGFGDDSDVDGDPLSVQPETVTTVHGAAVILQANGDFTYTPATNFFGMDSFGYTLLDGHGGSDTGEALITIDPANDAPEARDDAFTGIMDEDVAGNVLADNGNGPDTDPDGDPLHVQDEPIATAQGGTAVISASGDFTYTPPGGFTGEDSFEYTLLDNQAGSDMGTVNITVNPATDAMFGTSGDDNLRGTIKDDTILGLDGNDVVKGRLGNDMLDGGNGDDVLKGGWGDDLLLGGAGQDILKGDLGNDILDGGDDGDMLWGGLGNDVMIAGAGDTVIGGLGWDTVEVSGSSNLRGESIVLRGFNIHRDKIEFENLYDPSDAGDTDIDLANASVRLERSNTDGGRWANDMTMHIDDGHGDKPFSLIIENGYGSVAKAFGLNKSDFADDSVDVGVLSEVDSSHDWIMIG